MSQAAGPQRILFFCAVAAGVDTAAELLRKGVRPIALVGLAEDSVRGDSVSGWVDVEKVATRLGVPSCVVREYGLKREEDRAAIEALRPDLIVVTGWQRLLPDWLIALPEYGVIGSHGSPDGIAGGRGRSPQTWALLLGRESFDLSIFRITSGIDDGPVLATRTFCYSDQDDIQTSYMRASLATAEMVADVVRDPSRLSAATEQPAEGFYYPQRRPEDGWADWAQPVARVAAHCRALTRPYPGLRAEAAGGDLVRLWRCQPFDSHADGPPGSIGPCFLGGEFLIQCLDGRLLVREWSSDGSWRPTPGQQLHGRSWSDQLQTILDRHTERYPELPVAPRITREISAAGATGTGKAE